MKREAREGKALNESEAQKKVATYEAEAAIVSAEAAREAHVATNQQREQEAEADRDLEVRRAEYLREVNAKRAEAKLATEIEEAKQKQTVVAETMEQHNVEAQVKISIADKNVERSQHIKEGESLAALMQQRNEAEAIRVLADAESARIKAIGDAEASAILAKGAAEAAVLEKKADAYKQYGEAAMVDMVVERLPEIAHAVAEPLANTGSMTFVSSDGSAGSQLTGDVGRIMSQLPAAVQSLTGFDMNGVLQAASGQITGAAAKTKKKASLNGFPNGFPNGGEFKKDAETLTM